VPDAVDVEVAPPRSGAGRGGWVTLAARLALGAVWVFAGLAKIADPDAARRAVRAYELFPEVLVKPIAWGLPFVELALALLLVVGFATRAAAVASALLFVGFIGMIAWAWARGLSIDCGCFGGGGPDAGADGAKYAWEIARDVVFLGLAVLVAVGPQSRFALDGEVDR
jgi:uncharacterized membrane protein YphA (DoxX/SURF4 family)